MKSQHLDKSRRTTYEGPKVEPRIPVAKVDGRLFPVEACDLILGLVLRMVNEDGTSPPFPDCTVVETWVVDKLDKRVDPADERQDGSMVRLARPYVYASGGVSDVHLTGVEVFDVRAASLIRTEDPRYRVVVMSTGLAASYCR